MIADNENEKSDEDEFHAESYEEEIQAGPLVNRKGIGRNDLCPCNSGLKYKKCHVKSEKGLLPQEMRSLMHILIEALNGVAFTQKKLDEYPKDAMIKLTFDEINHVWKAITREPEQKQGLILPSRGIIRKLNFG